MIGARRDGWRWLRTLTPHLASPLEGGRDELGKREGRYGKRWMLGGWARRDARGERGYDGWGVGMVEGKWGDDRGAA